MAVVVRQAVGVGHCTARLAEQRSTVAVSERIQYPLFQCFWHDLAPCRVAVGFGQVVGSVVRGDLTAIEQAGEHGRVCHLAQLDRVAHVPRRVVEPGDQGSPVQDGAVPIR